MEPITVFVTIGIVFSIIAFAVALALVLSAVYSEDLKKAQRKKRLESAFVVLVNGIGYWVVIGLMFAFAHLAEIIDKISML